MESTLLAVRVVARCVEAEDICSFELVAADGGDLPEFSAGSHVDVHIRDGLIRQYSLCNDPNERDRYVICVLKDAKTRGGSLAMHEAVQAGGDLAISKPKNHFPLDETAGHSILFAGGIGITPLLSMATRLHASGRSFEMHYCSRSPGRTAFVGKLSQAEFAPSVTHHFDDGPENQRLNAKRLFRKADTSAHIYVCGPSGFMDFIIETARDMGWPEGQIHREYFAGEPPTLSGAGSTERDFEVQLMRSDMVCHVPADQTIVAALKAMGVYVPVSCEAGICGTCVTRVLEGDIDHRDRFFSEEQRQGGDLITLCCSRAKSDFLRLDL